MKKTLTLIAALFMIGCSGGGGSSSSGGGGTTGNYAQQLQVGNEVPLSPGYKIVNASPDAEVEITVDGNSKKIKLLKGSASIAKN